jgi:hypothetical protein
LVPKVNKVHKVNKVRKEFLVQQQTQELLGLEVLLVYVALKVQLVFRELLAILVQQDHKVLQDRKVSLDHKV